MPGAATGGPYRLSTLYFARGAMGLGVVVVLGLGAYRFTPTAGGGSTGAGCRGASTLGGAAEGGGATGVCGRVGGAEGTSTRVTVVVGRFVGELRQELVFVGETDLLARGAEDMDVRSAT